MRRRITAAAAAAWLTCGPACADPKCYMITYAYGQGPGQGFAAFQVQKNDKPDQDFTFDELMRLTRANAQSLGLAQVSLAPLGIFAVRCEKGS